MLCDFQEPPVSCCAHDACGLSHVPKIIVCLHPSPSPLASDPPLALWTAHRPTGGSPAAVRPHFPRSSGPLSRLGTGGSAAAQHAPGPPAPCDCPGLQPSCVAPEAHATSVTHPAQGLLSCDSPPRGSRMASSQQQSVPLCPGCLPLGTARSAWRRSDLCHASAILEAASPLLRDVPSGFCDFESPNRAHCR